MIKALLLGFTFLVIGLNGYGQNKVFQHSSIGDAAFIPNLGQFDKRDWQADKIEYGYDHNPFYIFFTKKGVTYRFDKIVRNSKSGEEHEGENHEEELKDPDAPKRTNISELIHANWIGANPDVEIIAESKTDYYFSYAVRKNRWEAENIASVPGYKKIIYKNLYDHIDVEYEFHEKGGIKYSIIVHPGGDPTQIKLKYSFDKTSVAEERIEMVLNSKGQIETNTSLAQLIEHAPFTFDQVTNQIISSKYKLVDNELSFDLGIYDPSHTLVIDPWVISPTYTTSTAVWEVETDGAGNIYSIGGETPMQLKKFNSAGVLQWTYTTPWDTSTVWLGTLATDASGISYITSGVSPEMERVSAAGVMDWHQNNGGTYSLGLASELWSITFNCDRTKLIVGGTYAPGPIVYHSAIFDVDVLTGNVTSHVTFDSVSIFGISFPPVTPIEVRSIASSSNAKYVFLTHDDVGVINQNFGACPEVKPDFRVNNTHNLGYKCENYLPATQNGGGLKALVANDSYFYTHKGDQILQWDINSGALINTVAIPGGASNTIPIVGGIEVENSGLAVDDCGNVYAGSKNQVHKYDQNLNLLASAAVSIDVYDVSVNSNGEVIVCGAQSDNSLNGNRNGRIEAVNMSACAQYSLVCCDANVCPADTVCETDPTFNLIPNTVGGTWSGTGVNPTTGVFNPATAGAGTHTITYTLACGSDEVTVVVDPCTNLTACLESNGDITITNGTGSYTWEEWTTISTTSNDCVTCGGTVVPIVGCIGATLPCTITTTGYGVFGGNGATQTPSGNAPYQVTDGLGSQIIINDPSTLIACSSTCTPPTLSTITTNVTCAGGTDGAVDLTVTGASSYSYSWTNSAISEDISNLVAGNYTVTVTDQTDPSCTATTTVTINDGFTPIAPTAGTDNSYCNGDALSDLTATAGSGGTLNWYSDAGLTANIGTGTSLTPGSTIGTTIYYVTETLNGCESPASTVTITVNDNPVISAENATDITNCLVPDGSISITSNGTSYELFTSGGASVSTNATGNFTGLAAGSYYVVVTLNGCSTQSTTLTISNASAPAAPNALADATYCVGDAMLDLTVSGTGGTYNWYSDPGLTSNIGTGTALTPGSTFGTTIYYVTETVAGCESPASTVTITIQNCCDLSVTTAITDESCDGANDGSVDFTIAGTGTYDVIIGGTTEFNDVMAGTQNWTGQADGTFAIQIVDINDPTCDTTFNVTINAGPMLTIGSESSTDITDCVNPDGTFTVTAAGATSYELYTSAGGLVTSNATGVFTGLNAGSYYVIAIMGTCAVQSSTLLINNPSAPSAPVAGVSATYCVGDVISDLSATAGSSGTLTWYDDAGLTNVVGTGTALTPSASVGTTIYYVTETVAGCESAATAVTITINAIPSAPNAGTDAIYCFGDIMTDLSANTSAGGSLNWYSDAGLTVNIGTGSTLAPNSILGTTIYYVTESVGLCESPASTVTVVINDIPAISSEVTTDLTDCTSPNGSITIASNGTSYELFDASNNSISSNTTGAFGGLGAGNYYVVVSNGNCTTTGSNLSIIDQTTSSSNTINEQVCVGSSFTFADGTTQTINSATSYVSTLTNSIGCDSIITQNVTVVQPIITIIDTSICEGGNYTSIGDAANFVNVLSSFQHTSVVQGSGICYDTIIENVTVIPGASVNLGADFTVCYGESVTITANSNTGAPLWNNGDTLSSVTFTVTSDTTLYATVTGICGSASDSIHITVLPPPVIDAGSDVTIPLGTTTQLQATSPTVIISYTWTPSNYLDCDDCSDPVAGPLGTITYIVQGTDENGCVGYDTISVIIDGEVAIYIPNIFSPNNDGQNDLFRVYGPVWKSYKMEIYNRWGGLIWESEDANVEWDGTHKNGEECPQAVFVYKFWGTSTVGQTFERTGNVMLTR
ncbi:MAG: gliding motility-associated C-terminal domain-containing protein [Crocinitomicaceae bacterium]